MWVPVTHCHSPNNEVIMLCFVIHIIIPMSRIHMTYMFKCWWIQQNIGRSSLIHRLIEWLGILNFFSWTELYIFNIRRMLPFYKSYKLMKIVSHISKPRCYVRMIIALFQSNGTWDILKTYVHLAKFIKVIICYIWNLFHDSIPPFVFCLCVY